jgi:hypothetical protein
LPLRGGTIVSDDDKPQCVLRNTQSQPIELHLPSGVIVLLPGDTASVAEADLATPQLVVLREARLVASHGPAAPVAKDSLRPSDDISDESDDGIESDGTPPPTAPRARRGRTRM